MRQCLNPDCLHPNNPDNSKFCQKCGNQLLLENRYYAECILGQGAFGRTFLARDKHKPSKPRCVIKQFLPDTSNTEKAAQLFEREAQQLEVLGTHPQIPELFAYFISGNRQYLIQQLVKGHTLEAELQRQSRFSENQVRELLESLLTVLQFVHRKQVIHRDIKPENIMLQQRDGKPILIDFGIAKPIIPTMTQQYANYVVGTEGYAPLEQMRGRVYPASDIYSLGVTSLVLLTGRTPDQLFNPGIGGWLWREVLPTGGLKDEQLGRVLDKMVQDALPERYQSVEEVLEALTPQFTVSPPSPSPPPPKPKKPANSPPVTPQPTAKRVTLKTFQFETVQVKVINKKEGGFLGLGGTTVKRLQKESLQRQAKYYTEDLGKNAVLDMVQIPEGQFQMGSPDGEGSSSEHPQHRVTVQSFFMGKTPITQAQWRAVVTQVGKIQRDLNPAPSRFKGNNRPVEKVSWYDAVEFCARLSKLTGKEYRLPSEAEWEYACRAGTETPFHFGETITGELANYDANYTFADEPKGDCRRETTPVDYCLYRNGFGLYDMHGNVWEWCLDPWHKNYEGAPRDGRVWDEQINKNDNRYQNPSGNLKQLLNDGSRKKQLLNDGSRKIVRGGSWNNYPWYCRSAYRNYRDPDACLNSIGLRVVRLLPKTL